MSGRISWFVVFASARFSQNTLIGALADANAARTTAIATQTIAFRRSPFVKFSGPVVREVGTNAMPNVVASAYSV